MNCKEAGLPLSFQASIERRSKKDAFSYIGSKAAWTGVPTLPLVGPVILGSLVLRLVLSEMGRETSALQGCFEG